MNGNAIGIAARRDTATSELISMLLKFGADPNKRVTVFGTPLRVAASV